MKRNRLVKFLPSILCFIFVSSGAQTALLADLQRLQTAYPDYIQTVTEQYVVWKDGSKMPSQDNNPHKSTAEKLAAPSLADQISGVHYMAGKLNAAPQDDPGRICYEPFFRKMYGNTPAEVQQHLTTLYWMPKAFGHRYPLQVSTINEVNKKLQRISDELEKLPVSYHRFLADPGGTFCWRTIANTQRLSLHSFGMTIDINTHYSHYWQWDLKKAGRPISEEAKLTYHNQIPWEIVAIFEKYGFIWGGKWYHYDTMHFEYRPELLM